MITKLPNHWDGVYTTSYTRFMVKGNMEDIENNVETIFIKINAQTWKAEKAWKGHVDNINKKLGKIHFRVNLDEQIPLSQIKKYSTMRDGWYIYN